MREVFPDYPKPDRPVDFVIYEGETFLRSGSPGMIQTAVAPKKMTGPGNTASVPRRSYSTPIPRDCRRR